VFTPDVYPVQSRNAQTNLGDEYFFAQDWQTALDVYDRAREVGETVLSTAYTETGRQEEVGEIAALYTRSAYCLWQLHRPE
jgi:hypothetical protein